jgi:hypothetical protein
LLSIDIFPIFFDIFYEKLKVWSHHNGFSSFPFIYFDERTQQTEIVLGETTAQRRVAAFKLPCRDIFFFNTHNCILLQSLFKVADRYPLGKLKKVFLLFRFQVSVWVTSMTVKISTTMSVFQK